MNTKVCTWCGYPVELEVCVIVKGDERIDQGPDHYYHWECIFEAHATMSRDLNLE